MITVYVYIYTYMYTHVQNMQFSLFVKSPSQGECPFQIRYVYVQFCYAYTNVPLCTVGHSFKESSFFGFSVPTWPILYYFLAFHIQQSSLSFSMSPTVLPGILTFIYLFRTDREFCCLRVGENRAVQKFIILGREFNILGKQNYCFSSACLAQCLECSQSTCTGMAHIHSKYLLALQFIEFLCSVEQYCVKRFFKVKMLSGW